MIKKKLKYDLTNDSNRKTLPNLKIITVLPDVYAIDFDLTKISNLSSLNLFEGLQKIKLTNTSSIKNLTIPASVVECDIQNCTFAVLSFEDTMNGLL